MSSDSTKPYSEPGLTYHYPQTSNTECTLVGNKTVDHSDVVGVTPTGTAPTTSSFSTWHLASRDWAKTTARWDLQVGASFTRGLTVGDVLRHSSEGSFTKHISPPQCVWNFHLTHLGRVMSMHHWTRPALVQIMVWHMLSAKPISVPVLAHLSTTSGD